MSLFDFLIWFYGIPIISNHILLFRTMEGDGDISIDFGEDGDSQGDVDQEPIAPQDQENVPGKRTISFSYL